MPSAGPRGGEGEHGGGVLPAWPLGAGRPSRPPGAAEPALTPPRGQQALRGAALRFARLIQPWVVVAYARA